MRLQLYKININFSDNTFLPITVASLGKEPIMDLIMSRRFLYERGKTIAGISIVDERATINMTDEKYDEEVAWCDIVQEIE